MVRIYIQFEGLLCDNSERLKLLPDFEAYDQAFPGNDTFNQAVADWVLSFPDQPQIFIITQLPASKMGDALEAVHGLGFHEADAVIQFKTAEFSGKRAEVFADQVAYLHEGFTGQAIALCAGEKFADELNTRNLAGLLCTAATPLEQNQNEPED